MKTLHTYISVLCLTLIGLCACTDDTNLQDISPENPNGDFVTLNLGYELLNDKEIVVTRSAATTLEKRLYDLHFYVFNEDGELTGYEEVFPTDDNDVIEEATATEQVVIRTKSGASYIYAVANINESTTYYLDDADLALLNIDKGNSDDAYWANIANSQLTKEKFLSIQFKRMYGDENKLFSPNPSGNVFVMSGYVNDGNKVTIPNGNGSNVSLPSGQNIVKLYRILAKNTFTVVSGTSNGTFTPKYYRLCNVPKAGNLIPNAGISTPATYLTGNVTTADVESSFHWNFEGLKEISFYFPENLQIAKNSNISKWKDREKNNWSNDTKTFTNAADNAAYIEIHGDYVSHNGKVSADVHYTIHLGDFSSSNKLNDFNVIRNYAYKYKVTVNGVDDIKVEAQTKTGEDNPYAEGLVVDATGGVHFDVDAHYEARVMVFEKSTIQALKGINSGYVLNIDTPFGETRETVCVKNDGVYRVNGDKLCDLNNVNSLFINEADYNWIKFVRNTDDNRINEADKSKNVCRYPGDNSNQVLNVFQLLAQLYDEGVYTEEGNSKVYYTCFVDEYYYANKSWPEYVDKDPRSMLIANQLDVSADRKSLYAKVAYSVTQRSISTFYTTNYIYPDGSNDLVKAFGTEIIDEEELYNIRFNNDKYDITWGHEEWKAWTSATTINQDWINWYDNNQPVEGKQPLFTTVSRACMSRNRDLNGDGGFDKDEIRWYLAAIDQYRALIFGQNALDQDAYLINRAGLEDIDAEYKRRGNSWGDDYKGHEYRGRYHYFTCSRGDKTSFWPEESLTNNPINPQGWHSSAQLVRCIRTLESNGQGLSDPEPFYSFNDYTFEMGGIKATRNYTEAPLDVHNEIEPANNMYSSFVVARQDLINPNNNSNYFHLRDVTRGDDFCRNYAKQDNVRNSDEANYSWRTPNQKELALMLSRMTNLNYERYATRTKFSGDDEEGGYWNWHETAGFWSDKDINGGGGGRINVGQGYLENGDDGEPDDNKPTLRIRCVRDKK